MTKRSNVSIELLRKKYNIFNTVNINMDVEKIKRERKTEKSCQIMMKLSDLWLFILIYTTKISLKKNKIKSKLKSDAHVEACYTLNAHFCSISILSSFALSFVCFCMILPERKINLLLSTGLEMDLIKAHFWV